MKSNKEHIEADLYCLGYTNPIIHIFMDSAVKWMGAGHRSINHSVKTLEAIEIFTGKEGRKIALLHLLIDNKIINVDELQKAIKRDKIFNRSQSKRKRLKNKV